MKLRSFIRFAALAILALCLTAEQVRAGEPASIRMAHLQIKQDQLPAFTASVKEEMEAALRVEPGVIAIYAAADTNNPAQMVFFEMYADENDYQIHRDTPHFQKYFRTTKDMITGRVLLELVPVELRDRYNTPADYADATKDAQVSSIRIAHLQIREGHLFAFMDAVKEEMEAALRVEPGVIAIYAAADTNDPTKMTFFEMYVDEAAYQAHRDTPHFQKYFHITRDMITDRILLEAVPVELRDKRNTPSGR